MGKPKKKPTPSIQQKGPPKKMQTATQRPRVTRIDEAEVREACASLGDLTQVKEYFVGKYDPDELEAFVNYHKFLRKGRGGKAVQFSPDRIKALADEGKPIEEIARILGCSTWTVRQKLGPKTGRKRVIMLKPTNAEMRMLRAAWSGQPESTAQQIAHLSGADLERSKQRILDRFLAQWPDSNFVNACRRVRSAVDVSRRCKCLPSQVVERLRNLGHNPTEILAGLGQVVDEEDQADVPGDELTPTEVEAIKAEARNYEYTTLAALDAVQARERKLMLARHRVAKHAFSIILHERQDKERKRQEIEQRRQALREELERLEEQARELA